MSRTRIIALLLAVIMCIGMMPIAMAEEHEPVTIRFSWWGGDGRHAATLEVINQFQELYPWITVQGEYGSSDGYHDKLATQLTSKTEPDIMQVDPETMPQFVKSGDSFVDLAAAGFDFSNFDMAAISASTITGCYNGIQLGVPTGIAGACMLVNADLAAEIGADFSKPYSWEDMITWGKAAREKGYYLLHTNVSYLDNMLVNNYTKQISGTTLFDPNTGKLLATEENLTKTYSLIKDFFDNETIAPIATMVQYAGDSIQSDPDWIAGKYVCTLTYISTANVMMAANPEANYIVGELPVAEGALNNGWIVGCPQILTVSKNSKNVDAAILFLNYFYNNEKAVSTLSTQRSVPPTAFAREIVSSDGNMDPILAAAVDILNPYNGLANDPIGSTPRCKTIIENEIEELAYGMVSPADAAAIVIAEYEEMAQ